MNQLAFRRALTRKLKQREALKPAVMMALQQAGWYKLLLEIRDAQAS